MANNLPSTGSEMFARFRKLFFFAIGAVLLATVLDLVLILHNPSWHEHLLRLAGRSWQIFVSEDVGSTSRGFFSGVMEAMVGIAAVAAMTGYLLGFKELKKHLMETAIIALFALAVVTFIVYGTQFSWEVAKEGYRDHHTLVTNIDELASKNANLVDPSSRDNSITSLKKKLAEVQSQLAARKQMVSTEDPLFYNMQQILGAFQGYRISNNGRRCVIWITAPHDSIAMGRLVGQLANSVTGCFTFGPQDAVKNPDLSEETADGAIPGVLLIHAPRDDANVNQLTTMLETAVSTQRSYKPLSTEYLHYEGQGKMNEAVVWLQFGTSMHWKSER